jgi:WD40 repeat protein
LASGSRDKTVKLWSVEAQKYLATLQGHPKFVTFVGFSPDSKYLVYGSCDDIGASIAKLWNIETMQEIEY